MATQTYTAPARTGERSRTLAALRTGAELASAILIIAGGLLAYGFAHVA